MGRKFYSSSRPFVFLNLSNKSDEWVPLTAESFNHNTNRTTRPLLDSYRNRPQSMEHISLWQMTSQYNSKNYKKLSKKIIIILFPKFYNKDNALANDYCRQEILLHHSWRDENIFLQRHSTWKDAYLQLNVQSSDVVTLSIESRVQLEDVTSDSEDENQEQIPREEWMLLSNHGPKNTLPTVELGSRNLDIEYDWHASENKYAQYGSIQDFQTFIDDVKRDADGARFYDELTEVDFDENQSIVTNLLDKQLSFLKHGVTTTDDIIPQRTIVQGKAGTGKSLLIRHIASEVIQQFGPDSALIIAPTGIAALSINGQIAHSALHLPLNSNKFKPLTGEQARNFCNRMEAVKVVILDEYSMVGCTTLAMMEQRCKEGTGKQGWFENLIVYFSGDSSQLPPVMDPPVYSSSPTNGRTEKPLTTYGRLVIQEFQGCVILKHSHRQDCTEFKDLLDRLSRGESTVEDFSQLQKRFEARVSPEERNSFKDAVRLFSTRENVSNYNADVLEKLIDHDSKQAVPVARIPARHTSRSAANVPADNANGLEAVIYLAKGCKVMLCQNVWTAKGLVNVSIGTVVDLLYEINKSPPLDPPSVILCQFPSYTGPSLIANSNIVPIKAITCSWGSEDGQVESRTQFPLKLCYAITIHKSQGLTLDKAVVDIGPSEFNLGLTYVGLSRVKQLNGLLLGQFCFDRINRLSLNHQMKQRLQFEDNLFELDKSTREKF